MLHQLSIITIAQISWACHPGRKPKPVKKHSEGGTKLGVCKWRGWNLSLIDVVLRWWWHSPAVCSFLLLVFQPALGSAWLTADTGCTELVGGNKFSELWDGESSFSVYLAFTAKRSREDVLAALNNMFLQQIGQERGAGFPAAPFSLVCMLSVWPTGRSWSHCEVCKQAARWLLLSFPDLRALWGQGGNRFLKTKNENLARLPSFFHSFAWVGVEHSEVHSFVSLGAFTRSTYSQCGLHSVSECLG